VHLAERGYALAVLTAVLIVAGTWANDRAFAALWYWPAALLLVGLSIEGWLARKAKVRAEIEMPPRALLGREQRGAYAFRND
jgi:hypothetical protein